MALLQYQQSSINGEQIDYTAADAAGDTIRPDERGAVIVRNGSAGAVTVTVVVPGTEYGQPRPDVPVSVPAGTDWMIGPFPRDLADQADALVDIIYSAVASVTRAAVRV